MDEAEVKLVCSLDIIVEFSLPLFSILARVELCNLLADWLS
jgi:hypothetical protein